MFRFLALFVILGLAHVAVAAQDLTVKVPPRSKECFFVPVEAGRTLHISYEVSLIVQGAIRFLREDSHFGFL
jgi:hypothetical protein